MSLRNLKIGTKIKGLVLTVLSTALIIGIIAISGFFSITEEAIKIVGSNKYSSFQYELRAAVQPMAKTMSNLLKGIESEEERLALIQKMNTKVRFFGGKRGYFFIYKKGSILISHPFLKHLIGKDLSGFKDKNGMLVNQELEKIALNGGGILNYFWADNNVEPVPEIMSYAVAIEGTDYWIGTFTTIAYIDTVKAESATVLHQIMNTTIYWGVGITLVYLFAIITPLTLLITRTIKQPIQQISKAAELAKVGDFTVHVEYQSEDELGGLAETFRSIASRQKNLAEVAETVAKGDLTPTITVMSKNDHLGEALQKMISDLNTMVREVLDDAQTISNSSFNLRDISDQMVDAFKSMSQQTDSVSGATTEISSNISTMASGSEEMTSNIHSISASSTELSHNTSEVLKSVEDISDSIKNVAQKSESASEVAKEANQMTNDAANIIGTLNTSAKEVGEVTDMIKEIANQTNLLALNANIEAASAGEAGKGFAVVANEIKELANQSAHAATDIGDKISHIQSETDSAVGIFNQMSKIVDTINENSSAITELTFEQTESANMVTANVQEASRGINEIAKLIEEMASASKELAKNSSELTQGSNEISKSISYINQSAKASLNDTENVQSEASSLSDISIKLEQLVKRFTLSK